MKIISYYTKDTPYDEVAHDYIIPSCKKFNLDCDIVGVDDLGNWQLNTGFKAKFVKEMLLKHKEPVVFIDADGEVVKHPELLLNIPEHIDIAYHNFDWFLHWRNKPDQDNFHLLSGTMYFAYNEKVLALIDEWITKVDENIHVWEQKVLEEIINSKTNLHIYKLPAEYCAVVMHDYSIPKYVNDPVIVHWQVSRKYKNRG